MRIGLISAFCLLISATESLAEVVFLGSEYKQTNGLSAQISTAINDFSQTETGATGQINHTETMGSFDLLFKVECEDWQVSIQAGVGAEFATKEYVSMQAYPVGVLVEFPDGEQAYLGGPSDKPNAQIIAGQRFQQYIEDGEPTAPLAVLIRGETNKIISRNETLLQFLTQVLLARACRNP